MWFITVVATLCIGLVVGVPAPLDPAARLASPRILNGTNAMPGQFPYMASISFPGGRLDCGASILTKNWLLTIAQCCQRTSMDISVGSIYLSVTAQRTAILGSVPHEDYNEYKYWANDICLIELPISLKFNSDVQPVKLPPQDMTINPGENVTVIGWGINELGHEPDRLQLLNYNVISNEECTEAYGINITSGQVCASYGPRNGACGRDSGGPLTDQNGVQIGIFSWYYFSCGDGSPDVYTRVPYYINWIQDILGEAAAELQFAYPARF